MVGEVARDAARVGAVDMLFVAAARAERGKARGGRGVGWWQLKARASERAIRALRDGDGKENVKDAQVDVTIVKRCDDLTATDRVSFCVFSLNLLQRL
ncbi:hypothetical protein chiPu_0019942 [Chiloscyllium punctatum]|uniref:Uncharacterized protein n=1 Tax=Chiloscyllium punctatum TaxID=137246 RepID=A0A401RTL6_CHIPU|nr:hypothetical protein [Chiloscyllium punctatum]